MHAAPDPPNPAQRRKCIVKTEIRLDEGSGGNGQGILPRPQLNPVSGGSEFRRPAPFYGMFFYGMTSYWMTSHPPVLARGQFPFPLLGGLRGNPACPGEAADFGVQ